MAARQPSPYQSVARKWLALAERRKAHLIALRESGRWGERLTRKEIERQLHELDLAYRRFAEVAGVLPAMISGNDVRPAAPPQRLSLNQRLRLRA